MRVLAVDWGERRLGLALSDALGITAQPLEPIVLRPGDKTASNVHALRDIVALAEEHAVSRIVLGLPLLLSGEKGEAARAVEAFADALRARVSAAVELWDERFTSALA